ncbi:WD repeat-containing protein 5-like [Haliotis asinina]|uniref:WD repeat-containing protein 5-like n=1 Tax=Haliotis asinina TaxID=109174 RepID=UPI003531A8D7
MSAPSMSISLARQIRKLRKKLRQIENLERLGRQLSEEERLKIGKKSQFREKLQEYLAQVSDDDDVGKFDSFNSPPESSLGSDDWSTFTETEAEITGITDPTNSDQEDIAMETDPEVKPSPEKENPPKKQEPPVVKHTSEKTALKKKKWDVQDPIHSLRKKWKSSFCFISEYPDHSDIVNDLVVDGRILVTASRDTTLKVWDLEEGRQLRNLGGHTGSVTTVFLLSEQASQKSGYLAGKPLHHRLVISGSTDCSFKIWNIATGAILNSVYTYNPITRLVCNQKGLIVTGSDGGKMEIWDMETGENLHSVIAFEGAVTAMKIADNHIYSTSSTGLLKVFQIRDNCLACMYESENLRSVSGSLVTPRFIRSLAVFKQMVFYGDDAINIKLLEWKRGIVKKIPNHTDEFASTDAICCFEDLLIASSYDLDNGLGYINIRSLPHGDYLATLDDEDTERIICLGCARTKSGNLVLVTGGLQLKVWEIDAVHSPSQEEEEEEDENFLHFISRLNRPGRDSDVESDSDLSDSDLDPGMDDDVNEDEDLSSKKEEEKSSWLSYCAIL